MAVQAPQYPSNVLLLNTSRNGQEGYDYSLQPQPAGAGGLIVHQPHMLFNNGGKRGRESIATMNIAAAEGAASSSPTNNNNNVINSSLFSSMQSPSSLIPFSHLHNQQLQPPNGNGVSTGLRLSSFADHQQIQLHQQQPHHLLHHHSSAFSSLLSQDFASQIKQHRHEIDQFLQAQEEQLRRTLAEKRQRHYRALLTAAEEAVAQRLREKELEVEKATRRNAELESRAAQLNVETQVWQAKAKAQEAMAAALQSQLQQAILITGAAAEKNEEGVLSCAGGEAEDAESAYVDPDRVTAARGPKCRGCGRRVASVVVLPCRHLCLCTKCDAHFRACPVCLNLKNSTVEVYLA